MVDDDLRVLAERSGWTVEGTIAVFRPVAGGWSARVSEVLYRQRSTDRLHVALIDPTGVARFTEFALTVSEARRLAEGWVRAKHPGV